MAFILNFTKRVMGYKKPEVVEQKFFQFLNQQLGHRSTIKPTSIKFTTIRIFSENNQINSPLTKTKRELNNSNQSQKNPLSTWTSSRESPGRAFRKVSDFILFANLVFRAKVWKLLLKYIPPNHQSQSIIANKKRNDYQQYVKDYYESIKDIDRDDNERKIIKIIQADVNRTQPDCELFRNKNIQDILSRLLFIYNMRYPMSGFSYVQGINDIASPLIAVFLNEYIDVDFKEFKCPKNIDKLGSEIFSTIEADTYWCLSKILQSIQDYYIRNQPGVNDAFVKIKELVKKVDPELDKVMEQNQIELGHFAFRWVFCLLIREFPLTLAMRIVDTYLSEEDGFGELHIYTCTSLLLKCAKDTKTKNFNDMIIFFQNLPTQNWTENQVQMLLAEAYVLKTHYERAAGHLRQSIGGNNSFV